jgi:hypothetical protein
VYHYEAGVRCAQIAELVCLCVFMKVLMFSKNTSYLGNTIRCIQSVRYFIGNVRGDILAAIKTGAEIKRDCICRFEHCEQGIVLLNCWLKKTNRSSSRNFITNSFQHIEK